MVRLEPNLVTWVVLNILHDFCFILNAGLPIWAEGIFLLTFYIYILGINLFFFYIKKTKNLHLRVEFFGGEF